MYVCGGVCKCVGVYACVCDCIYLGTRGRKETGSVKGNRERERKPVTRKEIKSAKVRARISRSAKIRARKTRSAKARTQKRKI